MHKNNKKLDSNLIGLLEGWLSIIFNVLLFALKYWAGVVTGSVAIMADAWHTLTDSISSIVVLVGLKISSKPPDKNHPFGHGRVELIAAVIIGVLLAIIAFDFILEAINSLKSKEVVIFGNLAIIVTIISIVIKEILAQYAFWAAKKTNLKSLKADAWHHRSDAISSLLILAGIFISKYFWWIDGVLGIIVSLVIAYTAIKILKDAINPLLGEEASEGIINQIRDICYEVVTFELHPHHFHIHNYGNHIEITFHLKFPPDYQIDKACKAVEKIEKLIKEKINYDATIHIEPLYTSPAHYRKK